MIRCSRPMSWALASTWPSGGRRSTNARAVGAGDAVRQVGVAAGDQVEAERRRGAGDVLGEPGRDPFAVSMPATSLIGDHRPTVPRPPSEHPTASRRSPGARPTRSRAIGIVARMATSMSPMPLPDRGRRAVEDGARRRRPVGAVVRSVPHARPDHREGHRRTDGEVVLVKVNVDENPGISQAFQVQSIPAVYALKDGQVVDGFVGAYPEHVVQQFVDGLLPTEERDRGRRAARRGRRGQPARRPSSSSRATRTPSSPSASCSSSGATATRRWPCSSASPRPTAPARSPPRPASARAPDDDYDATLTGLLDQVKADDEARQQFVDILELMGPDDPRTADYRASSPPSCTDDPCPVAVADSRHPPLPSRADGAPMRGGRRRMSMAIPFDPAPIELRRPADATTGRPLARPRSAVDRLVRPRPPDRRRRHGRRRRGRRVVAAADAGTADRGRPAAPPRRPPPATTGAVRDADRRGGHRRRDDDRAPTVLVVHVAGAVASPGVYELPAGARVDAALEAAGGAAADAEPARSTSPHRWPTAPGLRPGRRRGGRRRAAGAVARAVPTTTRPVRSTSTGRRRAELDALPGHRPGHGPGDRRPPRRARAVRLGRRPRGGPRHRPGQARRHPRPW